MILAVLQLKGGVGKTPLSFTLAKDLGLNWQSNDDSVVRTRYDLRLRWICFGRSIRYPQALRFYYSANHSKPKRNQKSRKHRISNKTARP